MLDVLTGEGLHDTAVVVTRYFGGTLLGTGGLVRAYQGAVKEGLQASTGITKRLGYWYEIGTDYTGLGKIQYILGQRQISVQDTQYTDKVLMKVILPYDQEQCVVSEITEGTNGQAVIEKGNSCYFAEDGKEILVLRNRTGRIPLYRTENPFCIGFYCLSIQEELQTAGSLYELYWFTGIPVRSDRRFHSFSYIRH